MKQYNDIFTSIRQKVAAFKHWREYNAEKNKSEAWEIYGGVSEACYLEDAYRFLFTKSNIDFMNYCAVQENMSLEEYCQMLEVDIKDLSGSLKEDTDRNTEQSHWNELAPGIFECSSCRISIVGRRGREAKKRWLSIYRYCPHCGAKMERKENNA